MILPGAFNCTVMWWVQFDVTEVILQISGAQYTEGDFHSAGDRQRMVEGHTQSKWQDKIVLTDSNHPLDNISVFEN